MQVRQSQYQDDVATTGTKISIIMPAFNLERKIQHSIEAARRAVEAITKFLHTQRNKLRDIIKGQSDPKNVMQRPHVRFDGVALAELSEQWAHAQNDAIGYWLWLSSILAREGHWRATPANQ